jgi:hypothetical protein
MATAQLEQQQLLIGGEWTGASSDRTFERTDPYTGEPAGVAPPGHGEGGVGGRHPAVDGALQQHFLDLVVGQPVAAGCPEVQASSSRWPRATRAVMVIALRIRRSSPGRLQISPQA